MGHQRLEGIRHFGRLYAAMTYHKGGCSQRLMHQYKYHGRIELANFIADLLIQSYPDWSGGYDYLLAVPMTESHLERRGYNQALLLARALSKRRGGQASDGHIIRSGDGTRQSALGKYERLGNAQSSFSLHPTLGNELIGKRLLIVDDILTSGATAMAMLDVLAPLETGLVDVCVGCVAE